MFIRVHLRFQVERRRRGIARGYLPLVVPTTAFWAAFTAIPDAIKVVALSVHGSDPFSTQRRKFVLGILFFIASRWRAEIVIRLAEAALGS